MKIFIWCQITSIWALFLWCFDQLTDIKKKYQQGSLATLWCSSYWRILNWWMFLMNAPARSKWSQRQRFVIIIASNLWRRKTFNQKKNTFYYHFYCFHIAPVWISRKCFKPFLFSKKSTQLWNKFDKLLLNNFLMAMNEISVLLITNGIKGTGSQMKYSTSIHAELIYTRSCPSVPVVCKTCLM